MLLVDSTDGFEMRSSSAEIRSLDDVDEEVAKGNRIEEAIGSSRKSGAVNVTYLGMFKDFFISAFSDGYTSTYCCSEGFLPCASTSRSTADCDSKERGIIESPCNSLQNSPSRDSTTSKKQKRPLALAAGYRYAEDMNGRPVVIRRGGR